MENNISAEQKKCEDFLNMAAHELKTPIAVLKAYLQLIMKRFERDKLESYFSLTEKMDLQLDRLLSLISDLPDGVKNNSEDINCLMSECNIKEHLFTCLEDLRCTHADYKIVVDCDGSAPILSVDHKRIEQVLQNLVTNAMKYGGDTKHIKVVSITEENHLYVSVIDEGPGIPQELKVKIFDKFYRIKGHQNTHTPGLGLGLHICQEIIFKHNGKIGVESKEGVGSEFWFRLPLLKKQNSNTY